eukprot:6201787-Pleurochrysis_carterae.AAC.1
MASASECNGAVRARNIREMLFSEAGSRRSNEYVWILPSEMHSTSSSWREITQLGGCVFADNCNLTSSMSHLERERLSVSRCRAECPSVNAVGFGAHRIGGPQARTARNDEEKS